MWRYRIISAMIACMFVPGVGGGQSSPAASGQRLRLKATAGSRFPLQVLCADGLPEMLLTVYADELRRSLSPGSVYAYVREVVLFANWALQDCVAAVQGWSMYGEPREVRNLVQEYLTRVGECRI